ncbi:MAG: LacI family transcriptional regulator [Oscillospiraceae bacterium]|nr:LacI family transcriptional regulator [Oscillospiraceae bacterium]
MSIKDIAKALGVSKTTVSRALSGNGRVSKETISRVREMAERTGFAPNASARNLAARRTHNIAFTLPLGRPLNASAYFYECLNGVAAEAARAGYDVITVEAREDEIRRIVGSKKADGLILSSKILGDDALSSLAECEMPIVLTGSTAARNVTQVNYDMRAAFRDLTMRLLELWSDKTALLLGHSASDVNAIRAAGFTDAATSRGLHSPLILWDMNDPETIFGALTSLRSNSIQNVVCGDDVVCENLLHILEDSGRFKGAVPNTALRVASLHSSPYLRNFRPDVPAVRMDPDRLGAVACQMLLRRLKGGQVPTSTLLSYNIHMG